MKVNREALTNFAYIRGLIIAFLFLSASGIMGREDHVILRYLVTGVSIWGMVYAAALKSYKWLALLGVCALLLNPVWHPHGMGRPFWIAMDLVAVALLGGSIVGLAVPI